MRVRLSPPRPLHRDVAQLGERWSGGPEVAGSIPVVPTTSVAPRVRVVAWDLAKVQVPGSTPGGRSTSCRRSSVGRALVSYSRGQGFDSSRRHHYAHYADRSGTCLPSRIRGVRLPQCAPLNLRGDMAELVDAGGFDPPPSRFESECPFHFWPVKFTRENAPLVWARFRVRVPRSAPLHARFGGHHGGIAQLGEQRLCKPTVAGSIPVASTTQERTVAQRQSGWFIPSEPGVRVPPVRPS